MKYLKNLTLWIILVISFAECARQEYDMPPEIFQLMNKAAFPSEMKHLHIIGDSLTLWSDGFYLRSIMPAKIRLSYKAVPGYDFPAWSARMDHALLSADEETVILVALGTNDGMHYSEDQFIQNLNDFHKSLRLRTQSYVWYAAMPRTMDEDLSNAIVRNNAALKANLPAGRTGFADLDSGMQEALKAGPLYPVHDPVHPSEEGYRIIGRMILQQIVLSQFF